MKTWQIQEAKAHLSEVVRSRIQEHPQLLTVRGKEKAVLLSRKGYERPTGIKPNLFNFMRASPLKGLNIS